MKEFLLSKETNDDKPSSTSVTAKWLSDLFQPDNIKDGVSIKRLE